jgi:hypothetical protein
MNSNMALNIRRLFQKAVTLYLQKVIQSMLATIEMQSPTNGLYCWTTYVL